VGGAFISAPLAIVVIGGLFTSTLLTLVLVPVLYSLASRFTGARTSRDLDALLDAAEDRRFKPLGQRTGAEALAVPTAPAVVATRRFTVAMNVEPWDGEPGDPRVLDALRAAGFGLSSIAGSPRLVRIEVPDVAAPSDVEATARALTSVRKVVPARGYRISEPVATEKVLAPAGGGD
jgi:hypothetical protein